MSRELFKSMTYEGNKVYTRQCSSDVNPKNYDRKVNRFLTEMYKEKGERNFEKFFITAFILNGTVEILNECNNTLRRLNYITNSLWKDKKYIELKDKEDELFTESYSAKIEKEKSSAYLRYENIRHEIANYVNEFYDKHIKETLNMERGR